MNGTDPGWKPALSQIWRALVPPQLWVRRQSAVPILIRLRGLWLGTPLAWFLFGDVLVFLSSEDSLGAWMFIVLGGGAASVVLILVLRNKPLSAESADHLAASYFQMSIVAWALTHASVLYGFVAYFIGGGMPAYLMTIPLGLAGFIFAAPTRRNLDRDQRRIRASGSALFLTDALMTPSSG